jgi:hypothetical protein
MADQDRAFLGRLGVVIVLHRDERKGHLQLRFSAADRDLNVRTGTLGVHENAGGGLGINEAYK